MRIPNSNREKALLVVDVQPLFINDRTRYILENICSLIDANIYSLYVQGLIHADENSLWFKQHGWTAPQEGNLIIAPPLSSKLESVKPITIVKSTRSIFKGEPSLNVILQNQKVEEVHIVGVDTYNCITASVHEAFDLGYFAYIIEECCQSTSGQDLHERAIANLRHVNLTNNSCKESLNYKEIEEVG